MRKVFVDFEMKPVERSFREAREICRQEIIEIGAVMLDGDCLEIAQYRAYVKPQYGDIPPFYANLTGVTNAMVENAPVFSEAMTAFLDWALEEPAQLYAWSDSDLDQLFNEADLKGYDDYRLDTLEDHWFDFQAEFMATLGLENRLSLEQAVGSSDTAFEGEIHDALWDARNTAALYRLTQDEGAFRVKMGPVLEALRPQTPSYTLGDKFGALFDRLKKDHGALAQQ